MLSLVEQTFVERDEKRAPLKMPAWEATCTTDETKSPIKSMWEPGLKSLFRTPARCVPGFEYSVHCRCNDWSVQKAIVNLPIRFEGSYCCVADSNSQE